MAQGFTTPFDIPIPVVQGGTGTTTSTGTGAVVLGTSPTITTPNLVGTNTNNNASAGSVGEYTSSIVLVGSAVALTTGVAANVTSISLTAGDWDVWGEVWYTSAATTQFALPIIAITTTSATLPTVPADNISYATHPTPGNMTSAANGSFRLPLSPCRASLSATTTYYLVAQMSFSVSTCSAYGKICARRVR